MERDCESELSKLNIEQNACMYHFGASVIHEQRSNILRLLICEQSSSILSLLYQKPFTVLLQADAPLLSSDIPHLQHHLKQLYIFATPAPVPQADHNDYFHTL